MQSNQRSEPKTTFNMARLSTDKFSITRTRDAAPDPEIITPIAPTDGFSIIIQLQDFAAHTVWKGQQLRYCGGYKQGSVSIPYMGDEIRCQHRSAYDNLKIYIPRTTLDEIQTENGAHKVLSFKNHYGAQDKVIYHLARAMLSSLNSPATANALLIDSTLLALCNHATRRYGQLAIATEKGGARLSGWQERRVKELIEHHLGQNNLLVSDLAHVCGLSRSYFSRAFKATTGLAPHEWMIRRRIEKARQLLLQTPEMTASEIALVCGFSDQSHFTHLFLKSQGLTPCAWRRWKLGN
ncbi:MAG: araC 1 [Pseudomonas sp.]|nr:araC 1 [Pseudomonas sp.]